ncbi:MAG: ATP-grasp domain-containing protein [Desulfobacterales bacterium]|nr:MAG: ATP-grasp domain-containing protein [Desulfobacterales bacterium]
MSEKRVVVVGTTTDYIEEIRTRHPDRAFFVTDPAKRLSALEPRPAPREELLCDLTDFDRVAAALQDGLERRNLKATAVACFDCESLELAAHLARKLALPFPSPRAVATCRNKYLAKQLWRHAGIPCPQAVIIRHPAEVTPVMDRFPGPVILKPLTGSGSELVFKCSNAREASQAFTILQTQLATHPDERMYRPPANGNPAFDSRRAFLMEAFIDGNEFSCDFIVDADHLQILRTATKIMAADQTAGTALAYVVPGPLVPPWDQNQLSQILYRAARALDLTRAICMVDFIVHRGTVYLLELTPRPGGDCLPPLIHASCGLDMLGLTLDFAAGRPVRIPPESDWKKRVGMRILAASAGIVKRIDDRLLQREPAVKSCGFKAHPGYRVKLPPEDYDSRVLGYVIFEPRPNRQIASQCAAIRSKLQIEMESNA